MTRKLTQRATLIALVAGLAACQDPGTQNNLGAAGSALGKDQAGANLLTCAQDSDCKGDSNVGAAQANACDLSTGYCKLIRLNIKPIGSGGVAVHAGPLGTTSDPVVMNCYAGTTVPLLPNQCLGEFNPGSPLTLEAVAIAPAKFLGWAQSSAKRTGAVTSLSSRTTLGGVVASTNCAAPTTNPEPDGKFDMVATTGSTSCGIVLELHAASEGAGGTWREGGTSLSGGWTIQPMFSAGNTVQTYPVTVNIAGQGTVTSGAGAATVNSVTVFNPGKARPLDLAKLQAPAVVFGDIAYQPKVGTQTHACTTMPSGTADIGTCPGPTCQQIVGVTIAPGSEGVACMYPPTVEFSCPLGGCAGFEGVGAPTYAPPPSARSSLNLNCKSPEPGTIGVATPPVGMICETDVKAGTNLTLSHPALGVTGWANAPTFDALCGGSITPGVCPVTGPIETTVTFAMTGTAYAVTGAMAGTGHGQVISTVPDTTGNQLVCSTATAPGICSGNFVGSASLIAEAFGDSLFMGWATCPGAPGSLSGNSVTGAQIDRTTTNYAGFRPGVSAVGAVPALTWTPASGSGYVTASSVVELVGYSDVTQAYDDAKIKILYGGRATTAAPQVASFGTTLTLFGTGTDPITDLKTSRTIITSWANNTAYAVDDVLQVGSGATGYYLRVKRAGLSAVLPAVAPVWPGGTVTELADGSVVWVYAGRIPVGSGALPATFVTVTSVPDVCTLSASGTAIATFNLK